MTKVAVDLGNGGLKAAMVYDPIAGDPAAIAKEFGVEISLARQIAQCSDPGDTKTLQTVTGLSLEQATDLATRWLERRPKRLQIKTAFLPAMVGVGSTSLGALSLGILERKTRDEKPVHVITSDGEYLVGANVDRYTAPLERFDPGKYADSPELRAALWALLAQLTDGKREPLSVIVALPVGVMLSPKAKELIRGIEAWMLGEHQFTYNGGPTELCVQSVRALAQPVGAFFAWGLNTSGEWGREPTDFTDSTVGILDAGFHTLDLLTVRRGRIEKRFTGGDDLGVRVAATEIASSLAVQHGIRWSTYEVDLVIREYFTHRKVIRTFGGKRVDLTPLITRAINTLATRVIDFVYNAWRNAGDFSYVLLVGGGTLLIESQIRGQIPHATRPTHPDGTAIDPVLANVIGLAKLAQRPGMFKSN